MTAARPGTTGQMCIASGWEPSGATSSRPRELKWMVERAEGADTRLGKRRPLEIYRPRVRSSASRKADESA